MSCIATSVGLGNIWRFPFTAYENGGGAFLVPYLIVVVVIGRPLYYMEMCVGQFASHANVKAFQALAPALKGVGYGQLIGTICVITYFCSLMAVTLFYLGNSFTASLPWTDCYAEWEKENALKNITCVASTAISNVSDNENVISSSELWFTREVLKEKSNIDDGIGAPEWRLTLCLLVPWLVLFSVAFRGVKSSGKASYFLALFPYMILISLLINACTLEGSEQGILYFIRPEWHKLLRSEVWYNAVTQCFFSLNVGFGSIIMYASYNKFDHDISRDALIVSLLDTFTSLLAGFTIFGILGNVAHHLNVEVKDVVKSGGTGLAFISYPEAIAKFPAVPWLFAILFFMMLFVLGIGTLIGLHSSITSVVTDSFPKVKTWQVSAIISVCGFLIGLVYVTPGGQFILVLVDYFGATFIIYILAIIEVTGVSWWYGLDKFCTDIEFMRKKKVNIYWRITWGIISPVLLIMILIYFLVHMEKLKYGRAEYPDVVLACGWLILVVTVGQLLAWALYYLISHRELGFRKALSKAIADENWRPRSAVMYEEWKEFKERKAQETKDMSWFRRRIKINFGI